jgi:tetratricopeptide (TPR) repeat protein
MSSKMPIVRQTAWISVLPQVVVLGLLVLIWYVIQPKQAFMFGAITYFFLSFSLRFFIPHNHRKGMDFVKNQNFDTAIIEFNKSYAYFTKHTLLDKYRYLTMLSSSRMSYREMALNNIAFCYGQLGNGIEAKNYYEKTLQEFPDSGIAKAALNMLNASNSINQV